MVMRLTIVLGSCRQGNRDAVGSLALGYAVEITGVDFRLVPVWIHDEQGAAFAALPHGAAGEVRSTDEVLDYLIKRVFADGKGNVQRAATAGAAAMVLDLQHQVAALALEVRAFLVILVQRYPEPAVIKVQSFVEVLDVEKDLFNANESHGYPLLVLRAHASKATPVSHVRPVGNPECVFA